MKVMIVRAEPEHCASVAERIREADKAELWATCCMAPYEALLRSWAVSDHSWTALFDGEPACVFGVTMGSLVTDTGRPWLIGSTLVERYPVAFLRACKAHFKDVRRNYTTLENYVDARNTVAIHWLKWLGFAVHEETEPVGLLRMPFHRFEMGR